MDSDGDDIPVRDTGSQRGRPSSGRNRNEIPNTKGTNVTYILYMLISMLVLSAIYQQHVSPTTL